MSDSAPIDPLLLPAIERCAVVIDELRKIEDWLDDPPLDATRKRRLKVLAERTRLVDAAWPEALRGLTDAARAMGRVDGRGGADPFRTNVLRNAQEKRYTDSA
jgi:hypothetical protein